jgi:hypothetical protein
MNLANFDDSTLVAALVFAAIVAGVFAWVFTRPDVDEVTSEVPTDDYSIQGEDRDAYFEGFEAWKNGQKDCPYRAPSERNKSASWHQGWMDAEWASGQRFFGGKGCGS